MPVRLFLGNLPYSATEADLRAHVAAIAPPLSVVLPMDRETGRPRGFAFVDYPDLAVATEVIKRLNGQPFMGRTISVSEARPREERGPRPPYSPGGPPPGGGFGAPFRAPAAPAGDPAARRERNFGPPAPPKGRGRGAAKGRGEGGPKGPIKVRGGGRVADLDEGRSDLASAEDFDDFATSLPKDDHGDEGDE